MPGLITPVRAIVGGGMTSCIQISDTYFAQAFKDRVRELELRLHQQPAAYEDPIIRAWSLEEHMSHEDEEDPLANLEALRLGGHVSREDEEDPSAN
jgi:hypothetical protein